jgi:hypothetical protein
MMEIRPGYNRIMAWPERPRQDRKASRSAPIQQDLKEASAEWSCAAEGAGPVSNGLGMGW